MIASELATIIKKIAVSDVAELGNSDSAQNTYIYDYLSRALRELAAIAFVTRVSDALNITADGYQTFLRSSVAIDDLYEPLRILNSSGTETARRVSYSAPTGWFRESHNSSIHTKNMTGNHTLHYKAYPAKVTADGSTVEFPDSGFMGLCFWTAAMIKESRPGAMDESKALYDRARERLKIVVLANEDARGRSSGGAVPSPNIVDTYFRV